MYLVNSVSVLLMASSKFQADGVGAGINCKESESQWCLFSVFRVKPPTLDDTEISGSDTD